MNKIKSSLIAFAGLSALIAIIAAVTPRAGYGSTSASGKDVLVVNTDADPVRVSLSDKPVRTTGPGAPPPTRSWLFPSAAVLLLGADDRNIIDNRPTLALSLAETAKLKCRA